jgi:transglutaminase-like putative cysteine protease
MRPEPVAMPSLLAATTCLGLALAPVVSTLPLWIVAAVAAAAGMRIGLLRLGRRLPPQALRLSLAGLAIGLLLLQFHTLSGVAAGTALLTLMAGLKLLETRSNRDLHVILFIVYFMSLAALLRVSSFWLLAYLVLLAWLTTATLLRLTAVSPGPAWRGAVRHSARIMVQAVPLALVLWLLFPRFNAPLWQLGDDGGGATTGLGDTMNPGQISDLALSDEIAFRVRFAGAVPPPEQLYWRGPVLAKFDGAAWQREDRDFAPAPSFVKRGPEYRYTVSMEPHRHPWIFLLDLPVQPDLANARMTGDYVLVQPEPVSKPIDVAAGSYPDGLLAGTLTPAQRGRDLDLPAGGNPRTHDLALRLRHDHPDDRDYIRTVLAHFSDEAFYYTLTPPRLGEDPVDAFLFDSRRGFCGHYASAFAVLMREALIPARVVTGYLGGAPNPYGDYWIVRQSDAHAWVEVWVAGSWRRVDPTAAIPAARVLRAPRSEARSTEVLGLRLPVRLPWLIDAALRLDALREAWRMRILRFDQNSQHRLLERLRIPEPSSRKLVLLLAATLSAVLLWLTWQVRRELQGAPRDELGRAYARFCAKLRRAGVPRLPHEGAEAHAERVAAQRPELGAEARGLARRYDELRYGAEAPPAAAIAEFRAAVRAFHPVHRGRQSP